LFAAFTHIFFFVLESFLWGNPKINKIFKMSEEQATNSRLLAFNQGFYNLFLAIAVFAGFFFILQGSKTVGETLIVYSLLSMLGASLVLYFSNRKLWRGALVQ